MQEKVELYTPPKKWYKRWWVIVLLVIIILGLLFAPFYAFQFYKIYKQVKMGTYISVAALEQNAPYKMQNLVDPMSPWIGAEDAPIQIVEFGDFNCKLCLKAFPDVRAMTNKYNDKVKFYWRNYPVISEDSVELAKAGICAHKQDKFWFFHDKLFQMQGNVDAQQLAEIIDMLDMDAAEFKKCLDNPLTLAQLKKDYYAADEGEVRGTPTFFVNGYKIETAVPLEMWENLIDKFLVVYEKQNE